MNKIKNYTGSIILLIAGILIGYFLGSLPLPSDRLKSVFTYSIVGSVLVVGCYMIYNKLFEVGNLKFKEELKQIKSREEEIKKEVQEKTEEKRLVEEKISKLGKEQVKVDAEHVSSKRTVKKRTGEEASTFLKNL